MKKSRLIGAALVLAAALPLAQEATAQLISMHCAPAALAPRIVIRNNNVAVTETVQVNINTPAPPGSTILVADARKDAVCTATIGQGYRFVTGSAVRDDQNIDGFVNMDMRAKDESLTFHPRLQGKTLVFTLYAPKDGIKGTANFKFYFMYDYER